MQTETDSRIIGLFKTTERIENHMAEKTRKTPGKMRILLIQNADVEHPEADGSKIIDGSEDISDAAIRALIEKHGPGTYKVITGRVRVATLSEKTVKEFKLV